MSILGNLPLSSLFRKEYFVITKVFLTFYSKVSLHLISSSKERVLLEVYYYFLFWQLCSFKWIRANQNNQFLLRYLHESTNTKSNFFWLDFFWAHLSIWIMITMILIALIYCFRYYYHFESVYLDKPKMKRFC